MWRKFLTTTALVSSISVISACGLIGGPDQAVKDFYKHLENGETNAAVDLMSSDVTDTFGRGKVRTGLSEVRDELDERDGIRKIKIDNEDISDEHATITYTVEFNDGTKRTETTNLVKEEGEWRITVSKSDLM